MIDPDHRRAQRKLEEFSATGVMEMRQPLWRGLGEKIALLGYDVQPRSARPGETVRITLWWEALANMDKDYTVFVHIVDPDGRILVQEDALLLRTGRGTSDWPAWRMARKQYKLEMPPGTPEGQYAIKIGVYYWEAGERLPIRNQNMAPLAEDAIQLAPITVSQ